MMQSRTHTCGQLRLENAGETVTLCGFMENVRVVGASLAFVILRDFYGTTQIVIETEQMMNVVKPLNKESTISVTGVVRERASKNPKMPSKATSSCAATSSPRCAGPCSSMISWRSPRPF